MSRIKYIDTIDGWNERGYKVTAAALNQPLNERVINREGKRIFSWGQVVPNSYSNKIINGQASYNEEEEDL